MTADDWAAALERAGIPEHLRSGMRFGSADDESGVVVVVTSGYIREQITTRLRAVRPYLPDPTVRISFEVSDGFPAPPPQGDDVPPDPPVTPPRPTSEPPEPAKATAADRSGKGKRTGKRKPEPEAQKIDTAALREELARMPWDDATVAELARIERCARIPTAEDLAPPWSWCPPKVRGEVADAILRDIARAQGDTGAPLADVYIIQHPDDGRLMVASHLEDDYGPAHAALDRMRTPGGRVAAIAQAIEDGGDVHPSDLHVLWCQCPPERRPRRHPCGPLVATWQQHAPFSVEAETRADRRIMPSGLWVAGPSKEMERGYQMFGGLLEGRTTQDIKVNLPLWPTPARYRVPMLEMAEVSKLPQKSRGPGAPLDRRLVIRGVISIQKEDRRLLTVRVSFRVKPLLNGLYKDGWRKRSDKWGEVEHSLLRMHNYTVPDAGGGAWFLAVLRRLPVPIGSVPTDPESQVIVDFSLPPGWMPDGASVDLPFLDEMGRTSGPRYNAYIAHRSLIWRPGITRVPVPGSKGKRFGWSREALGYPVLSLDELRTFAHGPDDNKHRSTAEIIKPWRNLPDGRLLANAFDKKSGVYGYRLLPDFSEGGPLAWL